MTIIYCAVTLLLAGYVMLLKGEPPHCQLAAVGLQLFALERAMAHAGMPW